MINYANCSMKFTHIVDRHCDQYWRIDDINGSSNLILVYDGEGDISSDGVACHVKAGDMIYYKKGIYRTATSRRSNPMKCLAICFELHEVDNLGVARACELPLPLKQDISVSFTYQLLIKHFREMNEIWQNDEVFRSYDLSSNFMLIVKTLMLWINKPNHNYGYDQKVERMLSYIELHIKEGIKIEDLAKLTGQSSSYVSRQFRAITGETIISYINGKKVEKAKHYLASGYGVTQCAKELGFGDVYYFSKVFKKHTGIPPSVYGHSMVKYF